MTNRLPYLVRLVSWPIQSGRELSWLLLRLSGRKVSLNLKLSGGRERRRSDGCERIRRWTIDTGKRSKTNWSEHLKREAARMIEAERRLEQKRQEIKRRLVSIGIC